MQNNILNIEKIFAHKEKLVQTFDFVRSNGQLSAPMPIHVGLGLVNYCNHNCNFCAAANFQSGKHGISRQNIDRNRLRELLTEMRGGGGLKR